MVLIFSKIARFAFIYFFPIIMINYYLVMRGFNFNTVIAYPLIAVLFIWSIKFIFQQKNDFIISLLNIYLIYNLLSIIAYFFNNTPIDCYIGSFRNFIFPFIFAYFGYRYSDDYLFNKMYIYGCLFCFLIGLYLYFTLPPYYVDFLTQAEKADILNDGTVIISRFGSFFGGSYAISFFSVPCLALSMSYLLNKKCEIKRWVLYLAVFSSFLAAILCQQRIAMACSILILMFYTLKLIFKGGKKLVIYFILTIVVVLVSSRFLQSESGDITSNQLINRFENMSFTAAMSSRIGQYTSFDRDTPLSHVVGLGMGSCGHIAHSLGLKCIADGDYIRIFHENGVLGFSIFLFLVLMTLIKLFKNHRILHAEGCIILFFLASMIGANPLEYFLFSVMFWFTLGHIWNPRFRKKIKQDISDTKS